MASMRDIKRRKRKYPEHTADYQSHETCFYRGEDVVIYAVGRKGIEILERKRISHRGRCLGNMENPTYPIRSSTL